MRALLVAALVLNSVAPAAAQPNAGVTAIGPITSGHCAAFNSTTVIRDAGFPCPASGPTNPNQPVFWGAVCDTFPHALSTRYATLADAQAVYPAAVSLNDQIDWAALQKMATAHQTVYAGSSQCVLNRQVTYSGAPFALFADGPEKASFSWLSTSASWGYAITHNGANQPVRLDGISFISAQDAVSSTLSGVALTITNTVTTSPTTGDPWSFQRAVVTNFVMRGSIFPAAGAPTTGWYQGIVASKILYFYGDSIGFSGAVGTGANLRTGLAAGTDAAFLFSSNGTDVTCCVRLSNISITWANRGIVSNTNFESLEATKMDIVNVNYGADISGTTIPSQFNFRDNHINALVRGIRLNGVGYPIVEDNLIFEQSLADTAMTGVEILASDRAVVRGNSFAKFGTQTFTNIALGTGTTRASVSDNKFAGDVGVNVATGATGAILDNENGGIATPITGDTSTVIVRGVDGVKQNWGNGGINTGVGEKYLFSGGSMLLDGTTSAPLLLNRTGVGDLLVVYNSFGAASWITSIAGLGVTFGRVGDRTGFFGATPVVKQTATGTRLGIGGLASVLTALANFGVLTDSTTADACTNGQLIVGQTGVDPLCKTISGDWTLSAAGVATLGSTIAAGGPTGSATVTPIITYDAKGRLTAVSSATVTPAVGSITGLGAGIATFLATPSSSNLMGALTDETGTGQAVFNNSPTLLTPNLGTPSVLTLTNATGLPIAGITGLGTGVGAALAVNVGSAGAFVTFNGAGGTPSSLTGTNITGTAAGLTAGNVTTNANLTGEVTSTGNATTIAAVAWSTASPTATCFAGTPTTITTATRYRTIGKTVAFQMLVTLTNIGTCTLGLNIPLPVGSIQAGSSFSAYNNTSGVSEAAYGQTTATGLSVHTTGGLVFPGANGDTLYVSGVYETP